MEFLIKKLNLEAISLMIFGLSFLISYFMIPKLIAVVKFKKLMDNPNSRSSHVNQTPTLAGLVFYVSLVMSLFFIHYLDTVDISINIIASLTILLVMGLKDDLVVLSAKSKIMAQLVAITFVILSTDLHITNFHGFIEIEGISQFITIGISYLAMLFIINAYNLIDGIDGLAGMLGILAFTVFAMFFYLLDLNIYFLLSVTCVGFLLAFLRYNLSKKRKIFMGDTGSMIVGFLLGILTLRFLALEEIQFEMIKISPENALIIAIAILFFPIIDVFRVIVIRLLNKNGPFMPDRRHLHHVFIDKGLPHMGASLTITISSVISFMVIYFTNSYLPYYSLIVLFIIVSLFTYYLLLLLDVNSSARIRRKKIKAYIPDKIYMSEFRIRKRIIIFLKKFFYRDLL